MIGLFACSKKDSAEKNDTGEATNREEMLLNMADNIILPAYANFNLKLNELNTKTDLFSVNPTVLSLAELRAAWINAYIEWQKVEQFDFGPAEKYVIRSHFNIYPANVTNINANITNGSANLDLPSNYTAQGFPALDYLVNGVANNDAAIVSFYSNGAEGSKRIAYLKSITSKMTAIFNSVQTEWNGSYRASFISRTGINASSSTSTVVNGFVQNYERTIRSGKFGIPSGSMLNGTVSPETVEAYYKKDISLTLAKTAHQAASDFYNGKSVKNGTEGPSLKTYLNSLPSSGTLADDINKQFNAITQKLNAIGTENLSSVVQNNNQLMRDVYIEMQKAVLLLKVDMTSALSIAITYTDNDGD